MARQQLPLGHEVIHTLRSVLLKIPFSPLPWRNFMKPLETRTAQTRTHARTLTHTVTCLCIITLENERVSHCCVASIRSLRAHSVGRTLAAAFVCACVDQCLCRWNGATHNLARTQAESGLDVGSDAGSQGSATTCRGGL